MKWLIGVVTVVAGVAHADAPPRCVDGVPELAAPAGLEAHVRFAGPRTQLCAGPTCKRVGKLLVQDLMPVEELDMFERPRAKPIAVSSDLRIALVGHAAYDVALDREIRPRAPEGSSRTRPVRLEIAGTALVATWGTQATLVDISGAPRGEPFAAGIVLPAGTRRVAVVSREAGEVTVLDTVSGQRLGKLTLAPGGLDLAMATTQSDGSISVTWRTGETWRLARVALSPDGVPGLESMTPVLRCR